MTEYFDVLYSGETAAQEERYRAAETGFRKYFGNAEVDFFSAPGRTEIGGNHTDHNHGCVLAAAVNLDIVAAAAKNNDNVLRLKSLEYDGVEVIELSELSVNEDERETSKSLLRGICARCRELGYEVGGMDIYTITRVLKGSGLSSSAAFEVLVTTVISHLYNNGTIDAPTAAKISQYAENVYFGKPSGLMDQMASAVGGFSAIDFRDPNKPVIRKVDFSLESAGYVMCIVDTAGNHADLTGDYAAIPVEMKAVARELGCEVLREADEAEFYRSIRRLRGKLGDRAVLRAMHFFDDNRRAQDEAAALFDGDFDRFKSLIIESGRSSSALLQNIYSIKEPASQGLSLALALSEKILVGRGAWRVHGGGFAGTVQAFVPFELLEEYRAALEAAFGEGACHVLSIRAAGGVKVLRR